VAERIDTLDAVRGTLALAVVFDHFAESYHSHVLSSLAQNAVLGFFAMSGYVLARAWDGRYLAFLGRRAVRLWPVYATAIAIGSLLIDHRPSWGELVWWPGSEYVTAQTDVPTWSLFVEAGITPILPFMFRAARSQLGAFALVGSALALMPLSMDWAIWWASFSIGIAAVHARIPWPQRVPAPLLWVGKVSYSLYLTHCLVLAVAMAMFGATWGPIVMLVAALPVAWAVWQVIERRSIVWSRQWFRAVPGHSSLARCGVLPRFFK
jgi:peptidoglycan/LPS O-acetylase OafA/YrhL